MKVPFTVKPGDVGRIGLTNYLISEINVDGDPDKIAVIDVTRGEDLIPANVRQKLVIRISDQNASEMKHEGTYTLVWKRLDNIR